MPLLKKPINYNLEGTYFCLAFSDLDELSTIAQLVSLFPTTQIKSLDVQLRTEVKWTVEQIKEVLTVIINGLKKTQINSLDLSCSNLYLLGIQGLNELLASLPANIETLVLSGNHWDKLNLSSQELAKAIRENTQISVLFEGTDEFEHQLTAALKTSTTPNRYQWFLPPATDGVDKEEKAQKCCVIL